jgi:hypothetical protein
MGSSLLATLHFLASMLRSHNGRKTKGHFPPRQWSLFLCITFSPGLQPNDKSYCLGQIWPALTALVYLASGLLLGRPPLLSLFSHCTWNSSVPAGMGFTISIKSSNSPPPRQLSLLPSPSGTKKIPAWTDEMSVGWARMALPIQIKLKNPSQFPHPKQHPLKPEGWGLMPIINSLKQQGLLVSCSSPYNKFKILMKVNFKVQVTK